MLALVLMYARFRYFGANIGGLFSREYADAPWSLGKVCDLLKHLLAPGRDPGMAGTASSSGSCAPTCSTSCGKPYVMTARARGARPSGAHLEVPGAGGAQPVRQHGSATCCRTWSPAPSSSSVVLEPAHGGPLLLRALSARTCTWPAPSSSCSALLTVVGTLISDLLLCWLDPRIRTDGRGAEPRRLPAGGVPKSQELALPASRPSGPPLGRLAVAADVVALPPPPAGRGRRGS